ncbi:DUF5688 family protein [Blautia sp. MSJ-19]|uniref:DUF5688 family protein n=1 Tax=Blautia sp. MSJ-19 TaxID=2841517 RepID=UPI001C0EC86B|nr:DUF5688 family protein [Blautia sp. MSJ-19]MBU5480004.1 hypothetical protein [Blautia sp. MSJ-19]
MENGYEIFVDDLRQNLLKATAYEEEMICYKTAEEYPPTSGDRLLLKNRQREGVYEVCALYVQDLYEAYQNGWSMESIVQEVLRRLDAIAESECFEKSKDLEEYDKIKDDLFIRLLNAVKYQEELKQAVYRRIGDIALVLYARMGELDGCNTSVKIKQHVLKQWNKDEQTVFNDALLNTYFISPPRIYCWEKLLYNINYEGENFMNLLFDQPLKKDVIGNCLSTSLRTNGAVAVFLPGVAQRLSELLDGSFYMVFTSIHEVMIHSERTADPANLKEVLAETVRETTPEEDFLTYYVYHYDRETGQFSYC